MGYEQSNECNHDGIAASWSYECQASNCRQKPLICDSCAFDSQENPGLRLCKQCRVAENLRQKIEDHDEQGGWGGGKKVIGIERGPDGVINMATLL